ncbi:MAG: hypothetical protein ACFCVG_08640 [Kineosporiaceae bacterium]
MDSAIGEGRYVTRASPHTSGSPRDRGTATRRRSAPRGDVAAAVGYLLSDAAGFVTAQRLAVNGGRTTS